MSKVLFKFMSLLAACGLVGILQSPLNAELPAIGDSANQVITPDEEYRMGKTLLRDLRSQLPILEDFELNYYLNNLGYDLVSSSRDIEFPFTFLLINDDAINAFAMPGGIIGINRGLIETAETESELAAVIAHEIAHVTQRHLARFYQESKGVDLKTALGVVAAAIIGSYSSEAGQAALISTLAVNADSKLRFSRANETDADRVGYDILNRAGYDTIAMQTIFDRLQQASLSDPDRVSEFLQTHPLPSSRISDAIRPQQSNPMAKQDSQDFQIAKARLTGITRNLSALNAQGVKHALNKPEQKYLTALSQLRNNQYDKALKSLKLEESKETNALSFQLLRIQTHTAAKNYAKAIELAEQLHRDYDRHPAVVAALSEAYILSTNPQAALDLLKKTPISLEQWPGLLKIKADAAQKLGLNGQSHEALAEYYYYSGDIPLTLEHVKLALKSPSISTVMRSRLEQNKKDLEKYQKENKKSKGSRENEKGQ